MSDAVAQETSPLTGENQPLLTQAVLGTVRLPSKSTPLPKGQLAILCLLRTLDPMSFTQIFPYINEFMGDLGVTKDPSRIGFYSGLVESAFAFSQLLLVYPWGYFSDRFGRRPVVLVGVGGLAITTLLFGLSTSFTTAMISRALAGLFSGNVAVIPSILCEITDDTNQASAFPFFGFWWPVGAIIGPLIGGFLSKPATRYPKYFDWEFLRTYPYFLPCLLVSSLAIFGFITSWLFLKEVRIYSLQYVRELTGRYSVRHLLGIPIIRALCASGCALSFISTAFDVLFVLFCFSPVKAGGLAFSTSEIGFALSTSGGFAALLQIFIMPTILRRVNHASMYHFCMKIWPYTFLSLPLLNIVARRGTIPGTEQLDPFTIAFLWVCIALILCMARVAFLAYTVNVLLVKRFAPNPSTLGSTLGLVQFSICFARAFSPAFASSTFAFSVENGLFAGHLWVVVMASIGFTSCLFSRSIVTESSKLL
ncbi:hypothetical protein GALMADRAFT_221332 [Galerina marginata CBS 339.88]|uniref:Major facilitator superfamily (MFS) profile domain-containing protein n=1 Tax=Galerina marginata (strain CBS 339.88) TaxID=685588 RepID=A0A067TNL3_GALM3|nr:hypothetical protein GALMADRAFT_221332 [Galerina marginata CBS 339.88]